MSRKVLSPLEVSLSASTSETISLLSNGEEHPSLSVYHQSTPTSQLTSSVVSVVSSSESPLPNAMLVSSPYKLVSPPHESSWNPWQKESQKSELMSALYAACTDDDLFDVYLTANDGSQVPACRFVLAARSPVLKRMLYGSFREAKSSTICMMGYERPVLQAVVHYCQSNQMPQLYSPSPLYLPPPSSLPSVSDDLEAAIRRHVRLYQAADFLELNGLGDLVYLEIRRLTGLYPGLACAVFDEVDDVSNRVGEYARTMMEVRPYVSLGSSSNISSNNNPSRSISTTTHAETANTRSTNNITNINNTSSQIHSPPSKNSTIGNTNSISSNTQQRGLDIYNGDGNRVGGVECLRSQRLQIILESQNLQCGELFLFQMLRTWYDYKVGYMTEHIGDSSEYDKQASDLLEAALECAKCLHMENIDPAALLQIVQPCPFIHPTFLFDAFAKQALRASQNKAWTLHSRPLKHQAVERVLVEDCGSPHVRGMYMRMVSGLKKTNATLYTKREVVSGQAMVYTMSCSVNQGQVECRIFCSPLLTPMAIPTLFQYHAGHHIDPLFQPILQIVAIKRPSLESKSKGSQRTVVVSDGHHCMQGTLANNMAIHNSNKEVQLYGVLQVLAFRLYLSSNHKIPRIHIQRVSIVNSDAGQVFGRPTFHRNGNYAPYQPSANPEDDAESHVPESVAGEDIADVNSTLPHHPSNDETYFAHHSTVKDLKNVTVLYSCSYPLKKKKNDDTAAAVRIPRLGWQVEDAGQEPPPTCTWLAPMKKSSSLSMASSMAASSVISNLSLQPFQLLPPVATTTDTSTAAAASQKPYNERSFSATTGNIPTMESSLLKYTHNPHHYTTMHNYHQNDEDGDVEPTSEEEDDIQSALSSVIHVDSPSSNSSNNTDGPLEV